MSRSPEFAGIGGPLKIIIAVQEQAVVLEIGVEPVCIVQLQRERLDAALDAEAVTGLVAEHQGRILRRALAEADIEEIRIDVGAEVQPVDRQRHAG